MAIANKLTEDLLRKKLSEQGYALNPALKHGETGVDIIAERGSERLFIEVIGFKDRGPSRAKDFFEAFFRAISRIDDGAENLIIALPKRFKNGLPQRASHYGKAWKRLGDAFPELEIWLVDVENEGSYKKTKWNDWLRSDD